MEIVEVHEVTEELVSALGRLMPQLGAAEAPTEEEVRQVVSSPATRLLIARDDGVDGRIVGTLTLASYRTPSVLRVWIEDVVVDEAVRGRGVGEALVRAALEHSEEMGARQVDLTSTPRREAANRLYRRLGFEQRRTNVYRIVFGT